MSGLNIQIMFNYSAIITSFNAEKTIVRALNSIINQTIAPHEVFLIDDNSTDRTVELASEFKSVIPKFQIVTNLTNLGQSSGRNVGANLAECEYLVFFDDDDVSVNSRAQAHSIHFDNGSDISFVSSIKSYPNGYQVYFQNKNLSTKPDPKTLVNYLLLGVQTDLIDGVYVPASTCAASKESFLLLGGFDLDFRRLEDVDLAIRFSLNNLKFSWTSEIGVTRYHSENITKGSGIDMEYEEKLLLKYRAFLKPYELELALIHSQVRKLYFSRSFLKLSRYLLCKPKYVIKSVLRIKKLFTRILHDVRKGS